MIQSEYTDCVLVWGKRCHIFIGGKKPLQDLEEYSQYIEKTVKGSCGQVALIFDVP